MKASILSSLKYDIVLQAFHSREDKKYNTTTHFESFQMRHLLRLRAEK